MSVRHHRQRYPSHHPNSKTAGVALPVLLLTFGLLLQALQIILPLLLLAGLAALIYVIYTKYTAKRSIKEEMRLFLQLPEEVPKPRTVGKGNPQASNEEARIHKAFCDYVQAYNQYQQAESHFQWLQKKHSYQIELHCSDTVVSDEELQKAEEDKNARFAALDTFALSRPQTSEPSQENAALFHSLTEPMKSISDDPFLGPFFKKIPVFCTQDGQTPQLFFTPWYALGYDADTNRFSLEHYTAVTVRSEITTVPLDGRLGPKDEIAETHWRYEKKDGGQDLRYKDNPMYIDIYKGEVIFSGAQAESRVAFPNKRQTEEYLSHAKAFLALAADGAAKLPTASVEKPSVESAQRTVAPQAKKRQKAAAVPETPQNEPQLFPELQPGAVLHHKTFGVGILTSITETMMSVRFGGYEKKFLYPQAIQEGYFWIDGINE